MRSANAVAKVDHFSIYSQTEAESVSQFDSVYKKIATIIQCVTLVCLLILILKKVSIFKALNVVSAFSFPTICVITPAYFYILSIKKFRRLRLTEYVLVGTVIVVGIIILILSFVNILFLE